MARAIEQPSGAPFAKFTNLGDKLIGAFAGGRSRQQINFETKAPIFKPDGTTPKLEEVMHFIAMPGTTAQVGDVQNGRGQPIEAGTHVRFAVDGFKWGQVIDQRKQLPAQNGFAAGQICSGDVYETTLTGWSAETKNAQAATAAGFTVVDGRIVLRAQEEKDRYVLAQSRNGGNTNPAKDFTITIRRPTAADKAWEQQADELYDSKPWDRSAEPAMAGATAAGSGGQHSEFEEPF